MQRNPNRPAARRLNIDISELRKQAGVIFGRRILRHQVAVRKPVAGGRAQSCGRRSRGQQGKEIGRTRAGACR